MNNKKEEIFKNIYWVGEGGQNLGLNCNPYLIVDGEEAVLIDPGSVLDFEYVYKNITDIIPIEKIKYVILHHQDPDFCSAVPLFEAKGCNFKIVTHWRAQVLIKFYGVKSDFYIVNKNEFKLTLKSGRILTFVMTPYLHFPGAITTYDNESKILFSSDLFGAFSNKWSLYADEDYIERMKTFHEHYMPSHEIMRSVMEIFLSMDISMIAPQHGSIIKDKVVNYIKALRNLECGSFVNPIKKSIIKSGGYSFICSSIIKRFALVFSKDEILDVIKDMDLKIDDNLEISDYNYTGNTLWNLIFEKVIAKKGLEWLMVIEPFVKTLVKEYEIEMPIVFYSNLKKAEEKSLGLNKENQILKQINNRLNNSLMEADEKLTKCSVTKLYNFNFFKNYLYNEINSIINENSIQKPGLLVLSVDGLLRLKETYGENELDEILRNIVCILNELKKGNEIFFRLEGFLIAIYIPHIEKNDAIIFAEELRNAIFESEKFIEKITISIGLSSFDEVKRDNLYTVEIDKAMYDLALKRTYLSQIKSKNTVCFESNNLIKSKVKNKILIIDTDLISLEVLTDFLENLGFEVLFANDGEKAIEIILSDSPDLIVSEIMLPKMDGFLIREKLLLNSNTKNIPYIFLSYLKDESTVKRASKLGVNYYIKKPFMISELIGIVQNTMKKE